MPAMSLPESTIQAEAAEQAPVMPEASIRKQMSVDEKARARRQSTQNLSKARKSVQLGVMDEVTIDRLIAVLEFSIEEWKEACDENKEVAKNKEEMNLAQTFEATRDYCDKILRNKDRGQLRKVFGGECLRITRIQFLIEEVELRAALDTRREQCLEQVLNVEDVLKSMGLEHQMKKATKVARHELDIPETVEESANKDIADAIRTTQDATRLEQENRYEEARFKYEQAQKVLDKALLVLRAVQRFKKKREGGQVKTMQEKIKEIEMWGERATRSLANLDLLRQKTQETSTPPTRSTPQVTFGNERAEEEEPVAAKEEEPVAKEESAAPAKEEEKEDEASMQKELSVKSQPSMKKENSVKSQGGIFRRRNSENSQISKKFTNSSMKRTNSNKSNKSNDSAKKEDSAAQKATEPEEEVKKEESAAPSPAAEVAAEGSSAKEASADAVGQRGSQMTLRERLLAKRASQQSLQETLLANDDLPPLAATEKKPTVSFNESGRVEPMDGEKRGPDGQPLGRRATLDEMTLADPLNRKGSMVAVVEKLRSIPGKPVPVPEKPRVHIINEDLEVLEDFKQQLAAKATEEDGGAKTALKVPLLPVVEAIEKQEQLKDLKMPEKSFVLKRWQKAVAASKCVAAVDRTTHYVGPTGFAMQVLTKWIAVEGGASVRGMYD